MNTRKNLDAAMAGYRRALAAIDLMEESDYRDMRTRSAHVSAATKSAIAHFVVWCLADLRDGGLDITPTVALHACRRILGRGVSRALLAEKFGRPGRTAAEQSDVGAADLEQHEELIRISVAGLRRMMRARRDDDIDAMIDEIAAAVEHDDLAALADMVSVKADAGPDRRSRL